MNCRCSWPDRPIAAPMAPFTCPHTVDHRTLSMQQPQGLTSTLARCTWLVLLFNIYLIAKHDEKKDDATALFRRII